MYPILPVFLGCPVLIAPSVYSNVCLSCVLCTQYYQCFWIFLSWLPLRFTLTFVCPVSCVPNITSVSGLSCLDYYQCFWIALSWLPLRFTLTFICPVSNVPNITSVSGLPCLDCPFGYSNVYLSCVLCTQYYQCFWIFLSWLPLRFTLTFICPVSCVPNITSVSGFSFLDCPFGLL